MRRSRVCGRLGWAPAETMIGRAAFKRTPRQAAPVWAEPPPQGAEPLPLLRNGAFCGLRARDFVPTATAGRDEVPGRLNGFYKKLS